MIRMYTNPQVNVMRFCIQHHIHLNFSNEASGIMAKRWQTEQKCGLRDIGKSYVGGFQLANSRPLTYYHVVYTTFPLK